jgi:hypothetical protein
LKGLGEEAALAQSIVRAAAAALCTAAALTACGPTETGPVIGVPQSVHTTHATASASDAIAAFQNALAASLNDAVTTTGSDVTQLQSQLNALNSDASLIAAERMTALKALGAQAVASRVAFVQKLIGDVQADPLLPGTTVAGQSVPKTLIARLQAVEGSLTSLGAKIAADPLIDVVRTDIVAVASSSRVYGLISPMTHIVIAAGDIIHTTNELSQQSQQLFNQITSGSSGDPNYSAELNLSNQLQAVIRNAVSVAATAIQQVESLQNSGASPNATLSTQKLALGALNAPNGPLSNALSYIDQIRYLLGLRQH